jgi:uncharacterized protein
MKVPNKCGGLETVAEQLALIDSTPIAEQVNYLKRLTDNPDKYIQDFQTLHKAYLSQDSDSLYEIISGEFEMHGLSREQYLDKRNQNRTSAIEKHLASKPTFVGFGAGHVGGRKGVVSLLRARGYLVTPIKL